MRFFLCLALFFAWTPTSWAGTHHIDYETVLPYAAPAEATADFVGEQGADKSEIVNAEKAQRTEVTVDHSAKHIQAKQRFGPFQVLDARRAAIVGPTDTNSPEQLAAMLRHYPDIALLEMVEAPGTYDDSANLTVGRMIRAAGIATHVPANGSVRSGAVELFLAGVDRSMENGAEFAVHAWMDERGLEADDYAMASPEHRKYLVYYQEMGMSAQRALSFYRMTNSVPHGDALWLSAYDMRRWSEDPLPNINPLWERATQLAYLDSN
ncbi:alpha/beta hydrolase [Altericroceibacterium endophyticum]|uniref:Alpha/beta hydrolase n=1 Tax=Altericroceibacterium endophyticum TaxID=1808508 RepID=A0A6I4T4P2_9SPHN|nr:alpha/beta hydrolase [Altericroceibacterium endophyticum]MXO65111.1 alpha/beta hydrolase [Altericroceibacterium endophyticum]